MTPIHFLSITIYSITKPTQYPRSYVIDNRFTWTVQSWHLGRAQGIPYTENHFHNGKTPEMIIHIAIAYTRCWRRWGGTAVNFSSGLLAFLCDGTKRGRACSSWVLCIVLKLDRPSSWWQTLVYCNLKKHTRTCVLIPYHHNTIEW